ncbi:hypothetical protein [Paraburkholderia terrae]|nr:hypothetical protein [Paraburkholderia terrae]GJH06944.1 hypothetical protein CBA19C8_40325 [Paraburkholderia terrae]GJH39414.1 hypothetical protein CBA19CS91_41675 [Paraburkholderia hospita]
MSGLDDVFWLSAAIFVAIIPLIWLTEPSKIADANVVAAGEH